MTGVLALSGGVGGAKLASGLSQVLPPSELLIVANTGDDFSHLGLPISPDLDSVMYALAGVSDEIRGWGRAGESWHCMEALAELGADSWFQLGDRDLATHVLRNEALANGQSLTAATAILCQGLGVRHELIPMSDQPVATTIQTDRGPMAFQHYFVREQCKPLLLSVNFEGADSAFYNPRIDKFLSSSASPWVVICPSNPMLSVDPILALPGLRTVLARLPVIAVSPIVAGKAIKGPAAKIMTELGLPVSALGVAEYYQGLVDVMAIDRLDAALAPDIEALGMQVCIADTVMTTPDKRRSLAEHILKFMDELEHRRYPKTPI